MPGANRWRTGTPETRRSATKQLLTSMDVEIIRRIKAAAALHDTTASLLLEETAKECLERRQEGKM